MEPDFNAKSQRCKERGERSASIHIDHDVVREGRRWSILRIGPVGVRDADDLRAAKQTKLMN